MITESLTGETNPKFVSIVKEHLFELPPPHGPAGRLLEMTFSYDENQIIDCEIKDLQSGNVWKPNWMEGQADA